MKKFLLSCFFVLVSCFLPLASIFAFSNIPSFDKNFANGLKEGGERVYDPGKLGIDSSKSLKENIRAMFYPDPYGTGGGGIIRNMIQIIAAGFFVAMIMFTGIQFIWFADDSKKITEAKNSILYVSYGGFLIFGSAYLVGLINFEGGGGSRELIENLQNNILVNIITFMKGITFFLAIIMMFWYGTQIIQALDAEDKRKKGISGVINVLSALVFIKLLDFVYYIAQQQDFKSRVTSLLVDVSKVVGYTLGGLMFLYLIYAGWLMIMSNGEDDGYKKATNTLKTLFMVALIIFLFLMIIYQLVNDLG